MQDNPETKRRLIEAALAQAAVRGWRDLSLADIAAAAGVPLAQAYALFPSKQAVLEGFLADIDRVVLERGAPEPGETAHDRLFDAVMRRFEALTPHRPALRVILQDTRRDPLALLCGVGGFLRSMAATLEAAGIASDGLGGLLRAQGLGIVYLQTLRVWLQDETPDGARTMAALDRNLRRAEALCGGLRRRPRRGGGEPAPEPPPVPAEGQSAIG
ncbi:MAG: TetR family transcriptional regulator [Rhodospirillaceae bacterium]|nr:TetR family transcriptional regulator [Rhodospirillaceae bacterium]